MGVVNVTPDSFVGSLRTAETQTAIDRALAMAENGASIIDVGGESTRPGAQAITVADELARVLPVISALTDRLGGEVEISIDTRHAEVARASVDAGATIVNDMSATLGPVAGELGVAYIAGHMQGDPATMQQAPAYDDVVGEVRADMVAAGRSAMVAGSPSVWIDPGIGFGKTVDHNLDLLARLDEFADDQFGLLIGVSRKSLIGHLHAASDHGVSLGSADPVDVDDRLEASLALAVWAVELGADIVRVHDVAATVQAMRVVDARLSV